MIAKDGELDTLAGRLLLNAFRGRVVETPEAAAEIASARDPAIHAALLPTSFDFARKAEALEALRKAARSEGLRLVAVGSAPDEACRKAMRRGGIDFLLVEPVSDHELRFVLNYAVSPPSMKMARRAERVPTDLVARVHAATGMKVASVYNLSPGGAFLETPRPSQESAKVEVELSIDGTPMRLRAEVRYTNVAGNLKRDNLPRGMGVQFLDLTGDQQAALKRYCDRQTARYRP